MSEVPLLSGLPEFLWLPLLAGGLLPVLVTSGLLLARRARGISLTTRTTLAALVLFGLGVGVMTWSATLAVLRVGLHQRHGQYLSEVVRVADDLGGYWREGPNLRSRIAPPIDLLRSANPDIGFVVLTRLHCDSDCIVLADADRPALRHFLAQAPSTDWAGREGSLVVGGELFSVVAAAVRDQRGQPIAVVLVGVEASEAARAAARAAWQLLLTAWTLLLVIALSTRGLVAASVTRRVKTLIARLEDPNAVPASRRNGDELVALSQALDEAIRHSVDRDRIQSARYQELVDNAPYGMCWLDGQHRITAGNPALARLLGAARASDLIGRDIRECFLRLTDGEALVAQLAGVTSLDAAEWNWCATDALPRTVRPTSPSAAARGAASAKDSRGWKASCFSPRSPNAGA